MWRVGAHQPAPRRVSWAGKHSNIKQQVTRDRMSGTASPRRQTATAARGTREETRHNYYDGEDSDSIDCERRDLGTFRDSEESEHNFHDNKG